MSARTGNVDLAPGASLDVHGDSAGSVSVAAGGEFRWDGRVDANGVARAGSVDLDVGVPPAAGDLSDWATKLASAGFGQDVSIRSRGGDLSLPAGVSLSAHSLRLTADQGSIRVAGILDATGGGGVLDLQAGDELLLASTSQLLARGTTANGAGGRVMLDAADSDRDGLGRLNVESGARIDLGAGDAAATGGELDVRVARSGADVALTGNLGQAAVGTSVNPGRGGAQLPGRR